LDSGYDCVLCESNEVETSEHLFFHCDFARGCWDALGIQWNLTQQITTRILTAKQAFIGPCFMEIIGCAAWNICKMRNDMIFEGRNASINHWKVRVQGDILRHRFKVKSMLVQPLINWMLEIFM
jgi:hypothetical protein